jgi:hypothetical protein
MRSVTTMPLAEQLAVDLTFCIADVRWEAVDSR